MKTISEHNNKVNRIKKMRHPIRSPCKLCQDGVQLSHILLDVLCDDCLIRVHRTKQYSMMTSKSIDAHCPICFREYKVEMP